MRKGYATMKVYELGRRTKDNTELLSEIKSNLGNGEFTDLQATNCLLSDISVSLAMIADLMNYNTDVETKAK